jgi:hypothetical protein
MRGTKCLAAAAFLVAALSAFGSNPPQVNIPDWMQQAANQPKGTYSDETDAVILLDETSVRVISADQYEEHERVVFRILRPGARERAAVGVTAGVGEKVNDLHAWSINPGDHKFEVKLKEFTKSSPYDANALYSDIQGYVTKVPGAEVGSVVAFESSVVKKTYMGEYDWIPQQTIPVKNASLTIEFPPRWEFAESWANSQPVKGQQVSANTWKWSLTDLPAIEQEPMRPSYLALAARLEVAFFGDGKAMSGTWGALGSWYKGLADPRRAPTTETKEAAQRLTAGMTGFDAQVRAVANFLQRDIRYVDISIGIGGHQPHFAGDVFHHRYGDCKDKATLMATMLEGLGYHSEIVLVHTKRGVVQPKVPSGFFNHAILAILVPKEVPDDTYPAIIKTKSGNRYVIFDPTNEYTPFGLIPSYEQSSYVLITTSPGEMVQLPVFVPELNRTDRVGKFTLNNDGVLAGEVVNRYVGDEASDMRMNLATYDGKDRAKFLEASASASLKQATIDNADFQNLKDIDHDLVIKYEVKMPEYAQTAGGLLLIRPRVFGDKAIHLTKKPRKYSIELEGSRHDHDIYEIKLPAGYVVDELPENTHIDVGFAMYDSKIESVGDTIRYTREYVIRDPHIELSKLDDVRRLESAIGSDEFANAVLKKAP